MTQVTVKEPVAFSTAGLPESLRAELWEQHNAEALIGLRCRTLTGAVLEATEINLQLERFHLARVRGTAHVVERDQALIAHYPAEAVALFFSLSGEAFFYHDDGVRTLRPGQVLICDADQPFMRGFSRGLEELVLKIPRPVFADLAGNGWPGCPSVVNFAAGGNAFANALAREVAVATRPSTGHPVDEEALLGLVAALLGPERARRPAAHRLAAHAFVDRHLGDPDLSASMAAAAVGISARQLSRVFADSGTTFPKYVLARRLDRARALLERSAPTVADVARMCGFTSAAHFSHAFRARFGEKAVDVRRRASG